MIAVFEIHRCTGLDKINSTEFLSFVILLKEAFLSLTLQQKPSYTWSTYSMLEVQDLCEELVQKRVWKQNQMSVLF